MLIIRPIQLEDLDQLVGLVRQVGHGLTTLPKDPDLLRGRVLDSEHSFARIGEKPRGETYFFVMEDLRNGKLAGTCAVASKVGGFEPFYAYKIETAAHESDVLLVKKRVPFLKLVAEHNGPCEIGSLFLAPEYRKGGNGRFLSLTRFLFIAERPNRFDPTVIAEMRGVIDDEGRSPFWEAIGRHFFAVEFPNADYLSMVNKKFIADLMPTHPIYIPLLPAEARAVIGQVHEQTRPALRILEEEGFRFAEMIDIFDGGPIVSCPRDQVRTVRQSVRAAVAEVTDAPVAGEEHLLAASRKEFRACRTPLEVVPEGGGGQVRIPSSAAFALGVKVGDVVRYVPMRAPAAPAALAAEGATP